MNYLKLIIDTALFFGLCYLVYLAFHVACALDNACFDRYVGV